MIIKEIILDGNICKRSICIHTGEKLYIMGNKASLLYGLCKHMYSFKTSKVMH